MNINFTSMCPYQCAEWLDSIRINKMLTENLQMLTAAMWRNNIPEKYWPLKKDGRPFKVSHKAHPCTLWVGEYWNNFNWMLEYTAALCDEFRNRFGSKEGHHTETQLDKLFEVFSSQVHPKLKTFKYKPKHERMIFNRLSLYCVEEKECENTLDFYNRPLISPPPMCIDQGMALKLVKFDFNEENQKREALGNRTTMTADRYATAMRSSVAAYHCLMSDKWVRKGAWFGYNRFDRKVVPNCETIADYMKLYKIPSFFNRTAIENQCGWVTGHTMIGYPIGTGKWLVGFMSDHVNTLGSKKLSDLLYPKGVVLNSDKEFNSPFKLKVRWHGSTKKDKIETLKIYLNQTVHMGNEVISHRVLSNGTRISDATVKVHVQVMLIEASDWALVCDVLGNNIYDVTLHFIM